MDQSTRKLSEALPAEQRDELGDLSTVTARLEGFVAPQPSPADTAHLLASLRPLVAARAQAQEMLPTEPAPEPGLRHWLHLAQSQTSLLEPPFWWASGGLFLLGIIIGMVGRGGVLALGLVLVAPVLAAAGVAYAFRPDAQAIRELEKASPIQPLELIYARLGLVLAFNLVLSLAALGVVWLQEPRIVLWRLVLLWLGPMLGLAGVALYEAVRWGAIAGAAVPLVLWVAFCTVADQWIPAGDRGVDSVLPAISQSNGLLAAALVLLLAGLLLLRQAGHLALREDARWNS